MGKIQNFLLIRLMMSNRLLFQTIICQDRASIILIVQMATISIHQTKQIKSILSNNTTLENLSLEVLHQIMLMTFLTDPIMSSTLILRQTKNTK